MHGRRAALFLLSVVLFAQPPGQKLYPTDETSRDPAFQSYTRKLRSAVAARSTKALRRLMDDEEIIVGPGKEDQGWRKFVARWRPDDPDSKLWPALGDLLAVGFIREHPSLFLSPYVVWRFPSQLDRRKHLVIGRDKVALRESPSLAAATVTTLAFDIVRRAGEPVRSDRLGAFVPVETLDGRRGYVSARDVLSPMLPRAQFGFRQKRWVLIALETE